ncbi:MAG: ferrochelatase [Methylothermaceae bacteria B42]|nr:MAG: ferrochelatase [Methylothermaceae bacteria B42]HHJ38038.1 ferrochelatase [Methylothermaceae bacterium]
MSLGVILVNLGTPSAPTAKALRRYLREFLGDERVVPLPRMLWLPLLYTVISIIRSWATAKAYRKIWMPEGSPLAVHTSALAEKLRQQGWVVAVAMRYGQPDIENAFNQLKQQGCQSFFILPLYPQYSQTTTGSVFDKVSDVLSRWPEQPSFYFLSDYHAEPAYIEAVADSIRDYWQQNGKPDRLLISFHGLPEKSRRQGDPYYNQCMISGKLIASKLGLSKSDWQIVFQSRFGPTQWLQPYCVEVLKGLPSQGIKKVDVVCPGFAVDCLETLEEIAQTNREIFLGAGGRQYRYIPALNAQAKHAEMVARIIDNRVRKY